MVYNRLVNPPTAAVPNEQLVRIIRKHLLPEFGRHGKHSSRSRYFDGSPLPSPAYFDPWWWPLDPANRSEQWGLEQGERDQLNSLCDIPHRGKSYSGFQGSLGATPGCAVLVGERPSFNSLYGSAVSGAYERVGRLAIQFNLRVQDFHVTDLIKFRGEPGHSTEDLCSQMINISVECLSAEFRLLQPSVVVITDMANELLPFIQSKLSVLDPRLDIIFKHPNRRPIRHWSRR
jgi:hypothetical protein